MEELFELKSYISDGRYHDALALIGDMEEMSKDDKINKIRSYLVILLLHLIKQQAEKRSTRSWEASIFNSVKEIIYINKRRKSGGYYLTSNEINESVDEAWEQALAFASAEAFGGKYSVKEISGMIDMEHIKMDAKTKIMEFQK